MQLGDFLSANADELEELTTQVQMNKPAARRFLHALETKRDDAESLGLPPSTPSRRLQEEVLVLRTMLIPQRDQGQDDDGIVDSTEISDASVTEDVVCSDSTAEVENTVELDVVDEHGSGVSGGDGIVDSTEISDASMTKDVVCSDSTAEAENTVELDVVDEHGSGVSGGGGFSYDTPTRGTCVYSRIRIASPLLWVQNALLPFAYITFVWVQIACCTNSCRTLQKVTRQHRGLQIRWTTPSARLWARLSTAPRAFCATSVLRQTSSAKS